MNYFKIKLPGKPAKWEIFKTDKSMPSHVWRQDKTGDIQLSQPSTDNYTKFKPFLYKRAPAKIRDVAKWAL